MILAAGLSPAWQQILLFDHFRTGEVNRAHEAHWCASGKVLNVGRGLFHLGAESRTLSLVGGQTGESIHQEFERDGIPARWITSTAPTRVCTTILDAAQKNVTELVENTAAAMPLELEQFATAFAKEARHASVVVLTGSLPNGTPTTYYRDLLRTTSARAVLDVRGPELLAALECRPWLVKPNREELAKTLGRELVDDDALLDAMREINRRGAEWVVITQGAKVVWAASAKKTYRLQPPAVPVVNPIGCGDAMCAGIAWSITGNDDPIKALQSGIAAAAENVGVLLPCRLNPRQNLSRASTIKVEEFTSPNDPTTPP